MKRYLAITDGQLYYILDYYPEEKDDHYKEYKDYIIGDFDTIEAAKECLIFKMKYVGVL
jgi:hypothetical protein